MQHISVFDMLKVGVGPSSSHTMGPWRAAERFLDEVEAAGHLDSVTGLTVDLYGSLAKTGKGHGTGLAVMMGLSGQRFATCDTALIQPMASTIRREKVIKLAGRQPINFDPATEIVYNFDKTLPYHPNGIRFTATLTDMSQVSATFYSVGGGFVVKENEDAETGEEALFPPYPVACADEIAANCREHSLALWEMVFENEQTWRDPEAIRSGLLHIWHTMADCVFRGCHTEGQLPGGLDVTRRAPGINRKLLDGAETNSRDEWMAAIKSRSYMHYEVVKWVSCFALATNEENAAFGRVVTAPTNGATGVIPAVLTYYTCFSGADEEQIIRFLLVAGQIGILFKKGATISAAMGGCQAEIGVASAMAAAALAEGLGGTVPQALMAAEIAMEHHLGMTCDPIGGLVQIPCIERNAMGAMKAITAANLALESQPHLAKVSLDDAIKTMWQTAQDMSEKYKETSEGGLALHIPVNVIEC